MLLVFSIFFFVKLSFVTQNYTVVPKVKWIQTSVAAVTVFRWTNFPFWIIRIWELVSFSRFSFSTFPILHRLDTKEWETLPRVSRFSHFLSIPLLQGLQKKKKKEKQKEKEERKFYSISPLLKLKYKIKLNINFLIHTDNSSRSSIKKHIFHFHCHYHLENLYLLLSQSKKLEYFSASIVWIISYWLASRRQPFDISSTDQQTRYRSSRNRRTWSFNDPL